MDRDEKFHRPADPYEEEYQRQLEEISRIAGDTGGEVDLSMGSADDVFASEYQRYGTPSQMGGQPYGVCTGAYRRRKQTAIAWWCFTSAQRGSRRRTVFPSADKATVRR